MRFFICTILVAVASWSCQSSQTHVLDVRDFGAVADSTQLSTDGIQAAVDQAHRQGGGTVAVRNGTYLSGTIMLKSNVTLQVEGGARIKGSPNIEDYKEMTWGHNKDRQPYHLIMVKDAENVSIEGMGTIDGNGQAFWQDYDPAEDPQWIQAKDLKVSPMLEVQDSRNVRITDVTLTTGGGWTVHLYDSDHITVSRVKILNNLFAPNGDGIDITGCSDVTISDNIIKTCDDAICLKTTGDSKECKRVVVNNNVIECSCAALKIGNESFRDISQVAFTNNVVYNSSRGFAIYAEGGGTVSDITVSNLIVDTKAPLIYNRPIQIMLRERRHGDGTIYAGQVMESDKRYEVGDREPMVRNILIDNVISRTEGRIMITSEPGRMMENIVLSNISMQYPYIEDPVKYKGRMKSSQFPHKNPDAVVARAAIVAENVQDLVIDNFRVSWPEPGPVPEDWAFEKRIANGTFDSFYPDYSTTYPTHFSAVYGKNLQGGYIAAPLSKSSGGDMPDYQLSNSTIDIIDR